MAERFYFEGRPFWTIDRMAGFVLQLVARLLFFYCIPLVFFLLATAVWYYPDFHANPTILGAVSEVLGSLHPTTQFWLVYAWHFCALFAMTLSWLFWPWPRLNLENSFEQSA